MTNKLLEYISSLENEFNNQFDYRLLPDLLSISDEKLIKMIVPIYFLSSIEDKERLLETLQREYSKFLKINIQLRFVKDYKQFGLFLLVFLFKNYQKSENFHEIVSKVEQVIDTLSDDLVTIDNIVTLVTKK